MASSSSLPSSLLLLPSPSLSVSSPCCTYPVLPQLVAVADTVAVAVAVTVAVAVAAAVLVLVFPLLSFSWWKHFLCNCRHKPRDVSCSSLGCYIMHNSGKLFDLDTKKAKEKIGKTKAELVKRVSLPQYVCHPPLFLLNCVALLAPWSPIWTLPGVIWRGRTP